MSIQDGLLEDPDTWSVGSHNRITALECGYSAKLAVRWVTTPTGGTNTPMPLVTQLTRQRLCPKTVSPDTCFCSHRTTTYNWLPLDGPWSERRLEFRRRPRNCRNCRRSGATRDAVSQHPTVGNPFAWDATKATPSRAVSLSHRRGACL